MSRRGKTLAWVEGSLTPEDLLEIYANIEAAGCKVVNRYVWQGVVHLDVDPPEPEE